MTYARAAGLFTYAVVMLLVGASAVLLTVASIPFDFLKQQLATLTLHGHADVFTEDFHLKLVGILRVAAGVPLVAAVVVFILRRHVAELAAYTACSLVAFLTELRREGMEALRQESSLHKSLLAIVCVAALGVRLLFLFQPMRYDEAYTFTHFASTPLYLSMSNFSSTNNHIFHTLLVQLSCALLGNNPWALRLPALVAGWLLVPATYLVGRGYFNRQVGLLAASLVASSSPMILFSTNARGYGLMTLFFLMLLVLAPYCLRSSSPAPWIVFAVASSLGFYTLPTMLYAFGIAAGWILLMALVQQRGSARIDTIRRLTCTSLGGAALTVLFYSPVLLVWGTNMRNQDVLPQPWEAVVWGLPGSVAAAWEQWNVALPAPVSVLLITGFVLGVAGHSWVSRYRVPLVLVTFLWIVPVVLVQRVVPYERVWIFLLPLFFVLASAGFGVCWSLLHGTASGRRGEVLGIAGVVVGVVLSLNVVVTQSVYYSNDTGTLRDGEAIADWMKAHLTPGDIIVAITPADVPLQYHLDRLRLRPADYWYSTQLSGSKADPGRRVLAVVQDQGPDLDASLKSASLDLSSLSRPELLQRFSESSIYQLIPLDFSVPPRIAADK